MLKTLIIEDDSDFAMCLKESLEEDPDLDVIAVVGSESEAMAFFQTDKFKEVTCILLDLRLCVTPRDSATSSRVGLGLLEHLRSVLEFYGNIIVLTNSTDPEDGKRALLGGCDSYLCKSVATLDLDGLLHELKVAIRYQVLVVSDRMRHVFFRAEISPKEAQLLDLLCDGKTWPQIAKLLDYNSPKAAANTADRIYDKLIPAAERQKDNSINMDRKRIRALDIWRKRNHMPMPQSPALTPIGN